MTQETIGQAAILVLHTLAWGGVNIERYPDIVRPGPAPSPPEYGPDDLPPYRDRYEVDCELEVEAPDGWCVGTNGVGDPCVFDGDDVYVTLLRISADGQGVIALAPGHHAYHYITLPIVGRVSVPEPTKP